MRHKEELLQSRGLSAQQLSQLTEDIKRKKELAGLADAFVQDRLFSVLAKNHKLAQQLLQSFHPKSAAYKQVIKEVRAQLRRAYGLFREAEDLRQRTVLLDKIKNTSGNEREKILKEILATSSATKERLSWYEQFWKKIFEITNTSKYIEITPKEKLKSKKIIDLGAGIHPFSLGLVPVKKIPPLNYFAYDLSTDEITLLQDFFDLLHQEKNLFYGKAEVFDALQFEELRKLPKVDVALLLKMTDVLDRGKGHKVSEYVISAVPATAVVVSFPTITMSGKEMNFPERKWIELMCKRLSYKFEKFELGKEIFYVVKK
ncbi:hypothetical protein HYX13_04785 [Candidatus Woesearchaeota archaeon]|nr:hypothetical protein [Candidatus Woesearchaeota archaeon]